LNAAAARKMLASNQQRRVFSCGVLKQARLGVQRAYLMLRVSWKERRQRRRQTGFRRAAARRDMLARAARRVRCASNGMVPRASSGAYFPRASTAPSRFASVNDMAYHRRARRAGVCSISWHAVYRSVFST